MASESIRGFGLRCPVPFTRWVLKSSELEEPRQQRACEEGLSWEHGEGPHYVPVSTLRPPLELKPNTKDQKGKQLPPFVGVSVF